MPVSPDDVLMKVMKKQNSASHQQGEKRLPYSTIHFVFDPTLWN
jgi:hypothetical protein